MTGRRNGIASGASAENRELLISLRDAVDVLSGCLEQVQKLIGRIEADPGFAPAAPRARVSYGGGPSILAPPSVVPAGTVDLGVSRRPEATEPAPAPGTPTDVPGLRPRRNDRFEGGGWPQRRSRPEGGDNPDRDGRFERAEDPGHDGWSGPDRRRAAEPIRRYDLGGRYERDDRFDERTPSLSGDHTFHQDHRADLSRLRGDPLTQAWPPRPTAAAVRTPELMAVSEMVHLGYSREQIAERLRASWGDQAGAILREALD